MGRCEMRLYSFLPFIWIQTVSLFKVKHTISVNSHLIRSLVRFCLLFGVLIQIDIFEARPMRECLCQYHSMPWRKQICDMEALKLKLMPTLFGKLRSELIGVIIIPMPCHRLLVFYLSLSLYFEFNLLFLLRSTDRRRTDAPYGVAFRCNSTCKYEL